MVPHPFKVCTRLSASLSDLVYTTAGVFSYSMKEYTGSDGSPSLILLELFCVDEVDVSLVSCMGSWDLSKRSFF